MHDHMEQIADRMAASEHENGVLRQNNVKLTADMESMRKELAAMRAVMAEINAALGLTEGVVTPVMTLECVRGNVFALDANRERVAHLHNATSYERRRRVQAVRWARAMSRRCAHWRAVARQFMRACDAWENGTQALRKAIEETAQGHIDHVSRRHLLSLIPDVLRHGAAGRHAVGEAVTPTIAAGTGPVALPARDTSDLLLDAVDRAGRLAAPQPPPRPGHTEVLAVCQELLEQRTAMGKEKYGRALEAGNGRDALVDAIQEAGDQYEYLVQLWLERQHEERELARLTTLRTRLDWQESDGPVLWWSGDHDEPRLGSPLDADWPTWPGWYSHWTPLPKVRP